MPTVIWLVTFALAMATVFSGVFMFAAIALSLWAGVFWYGVSTISFGVILRGWLRWRT